jgi:hypothetical protein
MVTVVMGLSACSDLRVIKNAAVREFTADGYNREQLAYRSQQ